MEGGVSAPSAARVFLRCCRLVFNSQLCVVEHPLSKKKNGWSPLSLSCGTHTHMHACVRAYCSSQKCIEVRLSRNVCMYAHMPSLLTYANVLSVVWGGGGVNTHVTDGAKTPRCDYDDFVVVFFLPHIFQLHLPLSFSPRRQVCVCV